MKIVTLTRLSSAGDRTLGVMHIYSDLQEQARFCTLELPWKDNNRRVSCIPAGKYKMVPEKHAKFGKSFRISGVGSRDGIMIHRGNYTKDTTGCILAGMRFADLDGDGWFDIAQSTQALDYMYQFIIEEAELHIFDATGVEHG